MVDDPSPAGSTSSYERQVYTHCVRHVCSVLLASGSEPT